jgi:copper transport protein
MHQPGVSRVGRSRWRRVAVVGALACTMVGVWAGPAWAHAVLVQTTPTAGQVLTKAPSTIDLRFDETVTASLGAVRLFDESGRRLDTGSPTKPAPDTVQVTILRRLPLGAYVVTWRVISADSHPVQGAFAFQVGLTSNATSSTVQNLQTSLLAKQAGSPTVGVVFGVVRWLVYASLALLIGAVGFLVLLWPDGRRSRRARRLVWGAWVGLVVGTVAGLFVEGVYGSALPIQDVLRSNLISDVLGTRFGHVSLARIVVLVAALPVLRKVLRGGDGDASPLPITRAWYAGLTVLAIGTLATVSVAGHAATGDLTWLAVPADFVHLSAMSLWIGGLVVLLAVAFPRRDLAELRGVVPLFSRLAVVCIGALVVTGTFSTWRQAGSLNALQHTDYGNILVVKLALVLIVIVIGARSRETTQWLFGQPETEKELLLVPVVSGGAGDEPASNEDDVEVDEEYEFRTLRRCVFFEVIFAVAILVVTALLVNAPPARNAIAQAAFSGGVTDVSMKNNEIWVDVTVAPGQAGPNDVHVSTLTLNGGLTDPQDFQLTFDLPSHHIAPISAPLLHGGPGHWLTSGFELPIRGTWRVTARVRLSNIDETVLVGTIKIR